MTAIESVMARYESVLEKLQISTAGVNGYGKISRWHVTLRVKQNVDRRTGLRPIKRDDFFRIITSTNSLRYHWDTEWTPIASAEAATEADAINAIEPDVIKWLSECMK